MRLPLFPRKSRQNPPIFHLATIQRLMGHSSISMTEVHLHISNELKAEAVEKLVV